MILNIRKGKICVWAISWISAKRHSRYLQVQFNAVKLAERTLWNKVRPKSTIKILQLCSYISRPILSNGPVGAFSSVIYCNFFFCIVLRPTFLPVLFKAVTAANNQFLACLNVFCFFFTLISAHQLLINCQACLMGYRGEK